MFHIHKQISRLGHSLANHMYMEVVRSRGVLYLDNDYYFITSDHQW